MKDKMIVKGRVKSAGVPNTPVAGAPQKKSAAMKGTRVKPGSEMSRKNDPPKKAQDRMGLKIGTRVTNSSTRQK